MTCLPYSPSRRKILTTGFPALVSLLFHPPFLLRVRSPRKRIPLVHISDLYFPPQDPDDLVDLLTVAALEEFDLRAVLLDVTRKFLEPAPAGADKARDPGFVPVMQLSYLLGRHIPVAMGPIDPLTGPRDDANDRPVREQAGISLLLDVLEESPEPVLVSCVGSARIVTAAYNRRPDLLRSKVQAIILNAGATGGTKREWNVGLDPEAFVGLWRSGLPLRWYPCATDRSAFVQNHERGTYWKTSQADLFRGLSPSLRAWIAFNFMGMEHSDAIGALSRDPDENSWRAITTEYRNLWSTASLIMAAGRNLVRTGNGWRFVPREEVAGQEVFPWRLDPIDARVNDNAEVEWQRTDNQSRYALFGREANALYPAAMTEALNELLSEFRFDGPP